jgi:hypothetical protein
MNNFVIVIADSFEFAKRLLNVERKKYPGEIHAVMKVGPTCTCADIQPRPADGFITL